MTRAQGRGRDADTTATPGRNAASSATLLLCRRPSRPAYTTTRIHQLSRPFWRLKIFALLVIAFIDCGVSALRYLTSPWYPETRRIDSRGVYELRRGLLPLPWCSTLPQSTRDSFACSHHPMRSNADAKAATTPYLIRNRSRSPDELLTFTFLGRWQRQRHRGLALVIRRTQELSMAGRGLVEDPRRTLSTFAHSHRGTDVPQPIQCYWSLWLIRAGLLPRPFPPPSHSPQLPRPMLTSPIASRRTRSLPIVPENVARIIEAIISVSSRNPSLSVLTLPAFLPALRRGYTVLKDHDPPFSVESGWMETGRTITTVKALTAGAAACLHAPSCCLSSAVVVG
ncbi:hypothetical protein K438DRAFT_1987611 [Mycena galopus ATCC 62051]|nr:hypothetical protein K438DRAFT_1987611 [Mycena galopus ATCC 62051]